MAFTDLIKPGDKIDIRLLQQVENEKRTGDTVKVYKSQVLDINKRGNLEISMPTDKNIYVAGAKLENGKLLTAGGRVLGVTENAPTLEMAINKAYETVKTVNFDNAYFRTDIGQKALSGLK